MAKMKEFKLIYHSNMVTMVNIANGYMVMIYMAIVFVFFLHSDDDLFANSYLNYLW